MKTKLVILTALGNVLIGLGIAILNIAGFGIDAFTSMTTGVSNLLGMGLGTFQMSLNLVMYVPVLFINRKAFGIGALINLFLLGYIVQYIGVFFGMLGFTAAAAAPHMVIRVILLIAGILILCFGCALYMDCDLGVAPYDALAPIIEDKTNGKIPFKYGRILTDLFCGITGFVSGMIGHITTAGLATVFIVLGTGPIVDWYRKHITCRWTR
ncbi:MAG: YitT family protein [Bulleidia sp.]